MQSISNQTSIAIDLHAWRRSRPEVRIGFDVSPFGRVMIASVEGRLAALSFIEEETDGFAFIADQWPGAALVHDDVMAHTLGREIFGKGNVRVPADGLTLVGTGFQLSVWKLLTDIPSGSVETYSDVARRLGRPTAVRAVATAIGRNPIALLVPCHRIVPSAGGIGGYRWGHARKRAILAWETNMSV